MGVEDVLVVAVHALDGRVDDFDGGAVQFEDAVVDALDGGLAGVGVADDASLADVPAANLELGFDEDDDGALPRMLGRTEGGEHCGYDEGGGDEGDVHGEEGGSGSRGGEEFAGSEEAGIGAFEKDDAGVVAKLLGDLAV